MSEIIRFEARGRVGVITLDNPPLNLGCKEMTRGFYAIFDRLERDAEIRAVVLTAQGRVFSAGSDMREMMGRLDDGTYVDLKMAGELRVRNRLAALPQPTIAALDASAFGGGFDLALACDMRIAAPDVVVSLPEVELGSFPGSGSAYRMTRLVGRGRAVEYMLFGRQITAERAEEMGLINAVAREGTALDMALRWAEEISQKSPVATRAVKAAVAGIYETEQARLDALQLELSRRVADSGHLKRGCVAFLNKEKVSFD